MKTIFASVVGIFAMASLAGAADTGFLDRTITVAGEVYRYQVYVPVEWTSKQKWPITLYLHGADPVGQDGMSHVNGAHSNAIRADRARFPAIFVLPQARAAWSTAPMQELALAALDAAIHEFNGDSDRLYLTGFSLGGAGVVRMAGRWPDRFAALIDVAGRIKPDWPGRPQNTVDQDKKTHAGRARLKGFKGTRHPCRSASVG
jgi:predicted peptidase